MCCGSEESAEDYVHAKGYETSKETDTISRLHQREPAGFDREMRHLTYPWLR